MYIHCKQGFVEVDRWDGALIPQHQQYITKALSRSKRLKQPEIVMVLRSRHKHTLVELAAVLTKLPPASRRVLDSPEGWDYPYRVYLSLFDFGAVMAAVIADLDYRNFKSWCKENHPNECKLAHDIWHCAVDAKFASVRQHAGFAEPDEPEHDSTGIHSMVEGNR